ncbi:MAG: response regulator transcription factor [Trueperaceae bacterium]|nr:response regulator transcription factor [Trueperaceae bacterium]
MTLQELTGKVSTDMLSVLVVEDELSLAQTIELYLRKEGYKTERASDGEKALALWRAFKPDLVILDIGLPRLDGLEVLKRIRAESMVPVIMLTARAEEVDELLGLGLGADDYIVKPASARILMARVKNVLKRGRTEEQKQVLRIADIELDAYAVQVTANGQDVGLTPTEFRLLQHLMQTPGRAISRLELLEVSMPESDAYERAVDIHMTNLRRKLKEAGASDIIHTVRGLGYRIQD